MVAASQRAMYKMSEMMSPCNANIFQENLDEERFKMAQRILTWYNDLDSEVTRHFDKALLPKARQLGLTAEQLNLTPSRAALYNDCGDSLSSCCSVSLRAPPSHSYSSQQLSATIPPHLPPPSPTPLPSLFPPLPSPEPCMIFPGYFFFTSEVDPHESLTIRSKEEAEAENPQPPQPPVNNVLENQSIFVNEPQQQFVAYGPQYDSRSHDPLVQSLPPLALEQSDLSMCGLQKVAPLQAVSAVAAFKTRQTAACQHHQLPFSEINCEQLPLAVSDPLIGVFDTQQQPQLYRENDANTLHHHELVDVLQPLPPQRDAFSSVADNGYTPTIDPSLQLPTCQFQDVACSTDHSPLTTQSPSYSVHQTPPSNPQADASYNIQQAIAVDFTFYALSTTHGEDEEEGGMEWADIENIQLDWSEAEKLELAALLM